MAHPNWITLTDEFTFNGYIIAPNGSVPLGGGSTLQGGTIGDKLTRNNNALLQESVP